MYEQYKVYGPYKSEKDGRLRCVLVDKLTKRKVTISYPKFLYEKHFNIAVPVGYDVHHKDADYTNNNISNLEIIKKDKHAKLHAPESKYDIFVTDVCIQCGVSISLNQSQQRTRASNVKKGKAGPFCSRECSGEYGTDVQKMKKFC